MSLENLMMTLKKNEGQSVFSYERIWKDLIPISDKFKSYLSPDSNAYYSIINPVFSFELEENDFQGLKIFSHLSLRDGIYPLMRFFTLNPNPHEIDPVLIVDARLSSVVPTSWRPKVFLREMFVENESSETSELLLVVFPDKDSLPMDILLNEFEKHKKEISSFKKISIYFSSCNLYGEEDAEFDSLWGYKILQKVCEKFQSYALEVINFEEYKKKNVTGIKFHLLNPFLFYFSDSFLTHDLLQRGAKPLIIGKAKNHEASINVSINHGFNFHQNFPPEEYGCDGFLKEKIFKNVVYRPSKEEDFTNLKLTTKDFKNWSQSVARLLFETR